MKPVIIVHGGAKTISEDKVAANHAGCRAAAAAGWAVLRSGGSAAEAVEAAIRVLESDQTFNAGFGSTLNSEGEVEVDAAMMDGATLGFFGRCMEVSIPDMKRMFDTNFWGVVYGSRAAVNHFKQRQTGSGVLINVGSFFGDRAVAVQSTYAASKHALHGWTDALQMELEAEGAPVSVTLIHPGRIDTPYNEHARSYLAKQPAYRGMIYPPEAVAEAILFAAEHPRRDMFVGFQAKFLAVLAGISPRLMDKIMEVYAFPSQQSDRPSRDREDNALYRAGYGLHERGTHQGWIRSGSLYVKAEKYPVATAITLASLGMAAWWFTTIVL